MQHVLTAAHCIGNASEIYFNLARKGANCGTYGRKYVRRAYVPKAYVPNSNSPDVRAYDFAVLELVTAYDEGTVHTMHVEVLDWSEVRNKNCHSVGYPALSTSNPNFGLPFETGPRNRFLGRDPAPGGGALWHISADGTGGQSGSPVYLFREGQRTLVGVMVGRRTDQCPPDATNWAAAITDDTLLAISVAMHPQGNPSDFMDTMELSVPPLGGLQGLC